MRKRKTKAKMSRMFQELEQGERVAVVIEKSEKTGFSEKIQGRSGVIESKRGKAYIVKITDGNKTKNYIIKPIHLKKIG